MICCLSAEMPMPVSATENASTWLARFSSSLSLDQPLATCEMVNVT
jgi:hypothetical protein